MCGYAISLARVKNVFFAARDQRFGFFSKNIDSSHKVKHFQLMEDEGRRIFDSFFRSKRN
jgi:tRNA(Arg) A34 adenosine deaminase TadA